MSNDKWKETVLSDSNKEEVTIDKKPQGGKKRWIRKTSIQKIGL